MGGRRGGGCKPFFELGVQAGAFLQSPFMLPPGSCGLVNRGQPLPAPEPGGAERRTLVIRQRTPHSEAAAAYRVRRVIRPSLQDALDRAMPAGLRADWTRDRIAGQLSISDGTLKRVIAEPQCRLGAERL